MKVELVQVITTPNSSNGYKSIHKYITTNIKPSVGDYICDDPLWKDPYEYKVKSVLLSLKNDEITVILDDLIVGNIEFMNQMVDVAVKHHGWQTGGISIG